ncbi:hypothetical protein DEO72_LG4g453 [Vigna unguiculata]|uniref:Uncharacterized protein n=1 Tax=Vigna unguiculata TaxID=3917 RepID=A0A4D6LLP0_VIGUN|nr:hypothetical protein DEO72_LG4g453 [Vigna unguiculata]
MFVLPVGVRRRLTYALLHLFRSSVICRWSFAFRCWRRTPLLALFQVREVKVSSLRETRARAGNLAQASRIRLGESDVGSPKPHCVKGRPGDPFELLSEGTPRPGERGETSEVALQWSGRNSMAHVSGCPWWCPICITSSEMSNSGSSRGIHHKCKHPLNPTKLYVSG